MTRRAERGRWANLWWEVLVVLLLVCGLVWMAWHTAKPGSGRWVAPTAPTRWGIVVVLVGGMAYVIAKMYWPLRRSPVFWAMSALFLCGLGASAYAWFANGVAGGVPRAIWFAPAAGAEFVPFAYLIYRKFHVLPKQRK